MRAGSLTQLPNLFSLSRIALVPFIGYFVAQRDNRSTIICVVLLGIAAITDFLDGYFARRLSRTSRLGVILDPIADKILAASLAVLLILYRDFPIWLAAVIVGRDLLILIAGLLLLRRRNLIVPSNLTGKYTFVAVAVLLFSYLIGFPFGMQMMTRITVVLLLVSFVNYAWVYLRASRTGAADSFADRTVYRLARILATAVLAAVYLSRLYRFLFA